MTTTTTDLPGTTVRVNGADIHYIEAGTGEPLLLLQGLGASHGPAWMHHPHSYTPHIARLAEHFRVIAPDTRGAGASVHPDGGGTISYALLADDLAELSKALRLDRPMVCGFSDGGTIATVLALRHPKAVRAVINDAGYDLFNPHSPTIAMGRVVFGGNPEATTASPEAIEAFAAQQPMFKTYIDTIKADMDTRYGPGSWGRVFELGFHRATRSAGYTFDDFASIEVPTLILVGDRDMFCSVEEAVTAYRPLRQGELCVVPNLPHTVMETKANAVLDFFLRHKDG